MKETIAIINRMAADGAVGRYAISGAVAAFNYIEVSFTEDLDILVSFEDQAQAQTTGLVTLGPIFKYLADKGKLTTKWQSFCDRFEVANPCTGMQKP